MQFYQLIYMPRQPGAFPAPGQEHAIANQGIPVIEWFGSERDAVRRRLCLFNAGLLLGKKREHAIHQVDVPTTKPELLTFLRREAV